MEAISKLNNNENNNYCFKDIKSFLIKKFLYESDIECINILLNIYDIEDSIENICPSYISLKHLKRDIIRFLKDKEGKELIAYNLSNLIHDDINRFELFMYLEGYRLGFNATKSANKLECVTFKYLDLEDIYKRKNLFNYEINNMEILNLKEKFLRSLIKEEKVKKHIHDIVYGFELHIVKSKIYNLNSHLDKQLVFDFESCGYMFKETNSYLNKKELYGLNKKIIKFLYIDGIRVFQNAYWDGINDRVMKRYK